MLKAAFIGLTVGCRLIATGFNAADELNMSEMYMPLPNR
jgi:hypothetical protein